MGGRVVRVGWNVEANTRADLFGSWKAVSLEEVLGRGLALWGRNGIVGRLGWSGQLCEFL